MELLDRLYSYISQLDSKQFKNLLIGLFAAIALLICMLLLYYYRSIHTLKKDLITLNNKRKDVHQLLERHDLVKKQQKQVDAILAQEKDFKISQFFEKLITTVAIPKHLVQAPTTTSEEVLEDYTEWTLDVTIKSINMKKLTELLHTIEQETRIYTKEIEITHPTPTTINVRLIIATLEPKVSGQAEE